MSKNKTRDQEDAGSGGDGGQLGPEPILPVSIKKSIMDTLLPFFHTMAQRQGLFIGISHSYPTRPRHGPIVHPLQEYE